MKLAPSPATFLYVALAVCGDYDLAGKLMIVQDSGTVLEVAAGTTQAQRVIVQGMDSDSRLNFRDQFVKLRARLFDPGDKDNLPRVKFLGQLRSASVGEESQTEFATLRKRRKCGD